ncbi:MAG: hypothetical protein QOI74_2754, partial [Micromonosporaceae bacterium]|nr:hypothetical protein [Micromonosporaceae bacterium]
RQASRTYNEGVDRASHALRVAATTAFSICLALLAMCSAFLLGYQRRVERQAAASRHDAMHDALTGLANRTLLADRVSLAMAAGRRHGTHVGLILIDLDGFKEVNDTLGHKFGDLVLQKVAARLNATIRDGDTVARLGGDEFAILLPELASGEQATTIAERLLEVLRRPIDIEQYLLEVGASIGIAVYPTNCDSAEQLLQNADIAMYAAKRGHLGIAEYDSSQNSHHPKQLTLLAELRRALEGGEIVLHYQPKADTGTGQICGVEALARWQHPLHGLMGPLEFIPLAEQGGLIELLTIHVLAEALDQCRKWGREGLHLPVAVNISSKCLADSDFPGKVSALLSANEVAPDMLTLEITETSVISNPDQALNVLRQVRALGVRLSVDDFGTGYSSMAYLQDMPITEVKIDRCFISRMNDEDQSRAIVHAVLDLARNLNLQVVAEGVEDQQTWDELSALGCDISQGFFFSKPLPPAELADWITRQGAGRAQPVA